MAELSKRPKGWYFIEYHRGEWETGYWAHGYWLLTGSDMTYLDEDLETIGSRIYMPDEQCQ